MSKFVYETEEIDDPQEEESVQGIMNHVVQGSGAAAGGVGGQNSLR